MCHKTHYTLFLSFFFVNTYYNKNILKYDNPSVDIQFGYLASITVRHYLYKHITDLQVTGLFYFK